MFSGAFPILPGRSDRVNNFERELEPHHEEWDRLSREGTFPPPTIFTWKAD